MHPYVSYKPRTKAKTLRALKETEMFSSIRPVDQHSFALQISGRTRQIKDASILRALRSISTITDIDLYSEKNDRGRALPERESAGRIVHLFFDIDSTLTHPGIKELDRGVKDTFRKLRCQKCSVYFCTGRSDHEVRDLIKMYKTDDYGIAENGGIIINSTLPAGKFGDRGEPDKLILYMNESHIQYNFDPDQQTRKTEYVIVKDSIKRGSLEKAVAESGARVDIHESKNTYHIGKAGINKGTAVEYLTGQNELGLDRTAHVVVAVGDSKLDIPMFQYADCSYAVGNADPKVKDEATVRLREDAPKALAEIYGRLFPNG